MPSLEQWFDAWSRFSVEPDDPLRTAYDRLITQYSEPQRHYHTVHHLDECLAAFREIEDQADNPRAVEIALWFHDAVYDTKATDNERRSANQARKTLLDCGVATTHADHVHRLVMATTHANPPDGRDEQVIVDADISILGAKAERFDEYERQVRHEYGHVPERVYRHGRRNILLGFLERDAIFNTARFHARLESRARRNIRRSLEKLR